MVKQVLAQHGMAFKRTTAAAQLPENTLSSENLLNMAFLKGFW
jgi:hypothetical protein